MTFVIVQIGKKNSDIYGIKYTFKDHSCLTNNYNPPKIIQRGTSGSSVYVLNMNNP